MPGKPLAIFALALLALAGGACTFGHQEPQTGAYQPLVFPGEARVGASAFMVIDTNQLIADEIELYDLDRERVAILVEGNVGSAYANLRSVFAIESGRATDDAELRRNAWMMVAFFDLPDETAGIFSAPYPQHAPLHLEVDGVEVPSFEGVIWVIGEGGEPTSLDAMPLLPSLEDELEPRTLVRLRARAGTSNSNGFLSSWTIGAIQVEVDYDPDCLEVPSAHAGSDAVGGGVTVGPPTPSPLNSSLDRIKVVLTQPRGFQLPVASSADPSRLGTGPILDIAFDRIQVPACSAPLGQSDYVELRSLKVSDRDGNIRIARPSPGEELSFDGSQFFHVHYVDPEPPL